MDKGCVLISVFELWPCPFFIGDPYRVSVNRLVTRGLGLGYGC